LIEDALSDWYGSDWKRDKEAKDKDKDKDISREASKEPAAKDAPARDASKELAKEPAKAGKRRKEPRDKHSQIEGALSEWMGPDWKKEEKRRRKEARAAAKAAEAEAAAAAAADKDASPTKSASPDAASATSIAAGSAQSGAAATGERSTLAALASNPLKRLGKKSSGGGNRDSAEVSPLLLTGSASASAGSLPVKRNPLRGAISIASASAVSLLSSAPLLGSGPSGSGNSLRVSDSIDPTSLSPRGTQIAVAAGSKPLVLDNSKRQRSRSLTHTNRPQPGTLVGKPSERMLQLSLTTTTGSTPAHSLARAKSWAAVVLVRCAMHGRRYTNYHQPPGY